MRAAFFGTPAIAVPALRALAEIADVRAVICQPDRPAGRGLTEVAPAVKVAAEALGLPVWQPAKVRVPEFAASLRDLELDVAVVMAYGRILPKGVLEAPRKGCINLHASLLPKYRGAAPITWVLANGERETGISLMQMDEGCDTGAVFTKHVLSIPPEMNASELADAIAALGAEVVRADLAAVVDGKLKAEPQDHAAATEARILTKEDGRIDWAQPAQRVHDHIRAMTPWPGATARLSGKGFKVLASRVAPTVPGRANDEPGLVTVPTKGLVRIACGEGAIELLRGQAEGRKALAAIDLLAGRTLADGMRFEVSAPIEGASA